MARPRITATELAKMLHAASWPIYVLDDEWTIVFCNRACRDWLGNAADGLIGQRCRYHSGIEGKEPQAIAASPQTTAAGLCPPPSAMAGETCVATVSCTVREKGQEVVRRARARFIPLGASAEDTIGLVAILDPDATAEPEPPVDEDGDEASRELHDLVRQFRSTAAGRYRADRLIGKSPAMQLARRRVELAAAGRCSVTILGPPGSGRQHLAAAIHYGAPGRSGGSLIPLDCSVLGADLIPSTVDALITGNPLGDRAGDSTVLLNHVDRLPPETQAELARLLVGKAHPWRLIATADGPLDDLVGQGEFRKDLAALLSTLVLVLPPLADRREDLPALAQLFLEERNAEDTRQVGGFSREALDRLDAYPWPGNLDELARMVAEMHAKAAGPEIGVEDLPPRIRQAADAAARPRRPDETILLDEFLARVERELIERALVRAKGNKARAARLLGMTRPRLYRRLQQLGLE
jgi:transcriptional regulator of acetoin/glycerol metabolism